MIANTRERETERKKGRERNRKEVGGQKESDRDRIKEISPLCGSHLHPVNPLQLVFLVVKVPLKCIESDEL